MKTPIPEDLKRAAVSLQWSASTNQCQADSDAFRTVAAWLREQATRQTDATIRSDWLKARPPLFPAVKPETHAGQFREAVPPQTEAERTIALSNAALVAQMRRNLGDHDQD